MPTQPISIPRRETSAHSPFRVFRQLVVATLIPGFVTLTGCAVGPDYVAPELQTPEVWHEPPMDGLQYSEADHRAWWASFDDPALVALIEAAGAGNLDVRTALLRIRESRALLAIVAGERLPTLGANASASISQISEQGVSGGGRVPAGAGDQFTSSVARSFLSSSVINTVAALPPAALSGPLSAPIGQALGSALVPSPTDAFDAEPVDLYSAGFDAAWELDVFGRISRSVEQAEALLGRDVEEYRNLLVSLYAEVALNYLQLRTLQAQLDVTQQNLALQEETLRLTDARFRTGLSPRLDVTQAQTNLETTRSRIPALTTALRQSAYRIEVLLGETPGTRTEDLLVYAPLPLVPATVAVGMPAELLRRRPDIRAAERNVAAAVAGIGIATAALYPQFSLGGNLGLDSLQAGSLLNADAITWGFGPSIRWNILNGARNIQNIARAETVAQQAATQYEQTLLLALEEVEGSMVAYVQEQERLRSLQAAEAAAQESVRLVQSLYKNGLSDFQNVLDTQRSLNELQNTLADSRGVIAGNLVRLYKALGGGWEEGVMPQGELLDDESAATARPFQYFFSGGTSAGLPYDTEAAEEAEAPAATE